MVDRVSPHTGEALFEVLDVLQRRSEASSTYSLFQGLSASLVISLLIAFYDTGDLIKNSQHQKILTGVILAVMLISLYLSRRSQRKYDNELKQLKANFAAEAA